MYKRQDEPCPALPSGTDATTSSRTTFSGQPALQPPPVSPTTYPNSSAPLEPLSVELFPVSHTIYLNYWKLSSRHHRHPLRCRLSGNVPRLISPHRQQYRVIRLTFPCPLPTQRVSKEPMFSGLRGFHRNHHLQTTPYPRSAILIATELLCLSLRRSHRSHDLPTRLLPTVSAVPTEATTY